MNDVIKLGMKNHLKYYYPILKNKPFTISYNRQWTERRVKHYLMERSKGKDVGGVFMPTDVKNGTKRRLEKLANYWQQQFPNAEIYWIDADNAKEQYWIKEHLQQEGWSPIDLLITSPVWASGIDIQGKFDLTAGLKLNPKGIFDARADLNQLTRERRGGEYIQDYADNWSRYNWDKYQKIFFDTKSERRQLQQILAYFFGHTEDKLPIKADELFYSDKEGKNYYRNFEYNEFINRIKEVAKHELKSKAFTTQELPRLAEYYGANVKIIHNEDQERKYPYILDEKPYEFNGDEEPTELRDIRTDIDRTLGYTAKTMADIYKYKALTHPPRQTIKKLIKEIRELLGDEMIITNPQFVLSDTYKKLQRNKDRYEALLGWTIDLNQEYISPIETLIKILNANGIDTKLQRGSSTQRRELQAKAKAEHSKQFNKWKSTNGVAFKEKHRELIHPIFNGQIQNLTYPLYLWNGLNSKLFTFDSLGEITKEYIRAHDHLYIEGGEIE